jgi:hypothetical protein
MLGAIKIATLYRQYLRIFSPNHTPFTSSEVLAHTAVSKTDLLITYLRILCGEFVLLWHYHSRSALNRARMFAVTSSGKPLASDKEVGAFDDGLNVVEMKQTYPDDYTYANPRRSKYDSKQDGLQAIDTLPIHPALRYPSRASNYSRSNYSRSAYSRRNGSLRRVGSVSSYQSSLAKSIWGEEEAQRRICGLSRGSFVIVLVITTLLLGAGIIGGSVAGVLATRTASSSKNVEAAAMVST